MQTAAGYDSRVMHDWNSPGESRRAHAATLQDDWTHIGCFKVSYCQINGLHLQHSSQWCHVSIMKSSLLPTLLTFIVSPPFPCKWGCKYKQTLSNTQLIRQIKWSVLVWLFNKRNLINLIHGGVILLLDCWWPTAVFLLIVSCTATVLKV